MRKLLIVLALLAFICPSAQVLSRDPQQEKINIPNIKCCFPDGGCFDMARQNCEEKMGKIVSDCKNCPGVWGEGK